MEDLLHKPVTVEYQASTLCRGRRGSGPVGDLATLAEVPRRLSEPLRRPSRHVHRRPGARVGDTCRTLCDTHQMRARSPRRHWRSRLGWARVAQLGQAHWFFGNLYESVVGVPQLLIDAQPRRTPGLLGSGSPVRYFVPVAPLTLGATAASLVRSWRAGGDRWPIVTATASTMSAVGLTAYLVRTVNLRLLRGEPLSESDRGRLLRTFHRANAVRLVAVAVAAFALRRADSGHLDGGASPRRPLNR